MILLLLAATAAADPGAARIVSTAGGISEIIFYLGADRRLAGVDAASCWPEAAKALPQVGYMRRLSAEGILSLAPSLVLAGPYAGPPSVFPIKPGRHSDCNVASDANPRRCTAKFEP